MEVVPPKGNARRGLIYIVGLELPWGQSLADFASFKLPFDCEAFDIAGTPQAFQVAVFSHVVYESRDVRLQFHNIPTSLNVLHEELK